MWDNRTTKKNPKQPDYRCRDRGCDGVIWPPKGAQPVLAYNPADGPRRLTAPPATSTPARSVPRPLQDDFDAINEGPPQPVDETRRFAIVQGYADALQEAVDLFAINGATFDTLSSEDKRTAAAMAATIFISWKGDKLI